MLLQGLALSFASSVAWCVLFNVPVRTIVAGGFAGVVGFLVYSILPIYGAEVLLSTFVSAAAVSLLSQLLSIILRVPSTNFSVAGIIPLVPGSLAYKAMLAFVNNDYVGGITLATKTLMVAGAIASGLIFGISVLTIWKGARYAGNRAQRD
ncbi:MULTISPECIES: threonine/serine exporter family protein [Brevibacillus]|uniref:Threonine/serine exporter n=1 Tax=Brevibacillus porteri TaxID=2126350 RepID=A0ABX5FHY4_9BACL|nr:MULTISPECIES: threonine/serine exporter family protein [Brevibacillus]MDC0764662.1 threonine/serine exporter family protein [Brevibacillus sp. AG]MED1801897.1 threonine/serine exporter family protein [Brevibacillus porteri]MED2132458.1 threonine/serine exporter family protein [Brevibacillus porteri]MED2745337.1 threonine/serine exporter family protein [Brevibacillus porteri]MED2814386.1 threonine/serine exporter family protein [Brevibacillus porteri]